MAFRADKDTNDVNELYVACAGGPGEPVKASGTIGADRHVGGDAAWSPLSN